MVKQTAGAKKAAAKNASKKNAAAVEPNDFNSPGAAISAPDASLNLKYYAKVNECIATINQKWPTLSALDPLPVSGDTGFDKLVGLGAPFDAVAYDAHQVDGTEYSTHINFLWQHATLSVMPYVPLYWEKVVEYADIHVTSPKIQKSNTLTLLADFCSGAQLPKGHVKRLSPCEYAHAVLYRVSQRIAADAPSSELREWSRLLLSFPAVFVKLLNHDEQYSEANSLREDQSGSARVAVLTTRQMVENISGFKALKESTTKQKFGAEALHTFWKSTVRISKQNESFLKKSTFDACLTLKSRFYCLEGIDDVVVAAETSTGPNSLWNQLFKIQEIIYRCQRKEKIRWVVFCLNDALLSGRYTDSEITITSLKSGPKSLTDVYLTQLEMKNHLLGPWMDARDFPLYMKIKAREIFDSHHSWRSLWHPLHNNDIDTTWLFSWPRFGRELLDMLESCIFLPTGHEEHFYRQAVKNSTTMDELLATKPWIDTIKHLHDSMRATAEPSVATSTRATNNEDISYHDELHDAEHDDEDHDDDDDPTGPRALSDAVSRLTKQQCSFLIEASSYDGMRQLFEGCPLAMVRASNESGNVLVLFDANVWGTTDHRPDRRAVPIGKDKFDIPLRAVIAARHGAAEPESLHLGDIYTCVSGGRDRKRLFTKPIKNDNMKGGRDKHRTVTRTMMLHFTEQSWRLRRRRNRGLAKLTQAVYTVCNSATLANMRHTTFTSITGSNRSDVCGPIELDNAADLPTLPTPAHIKDFYGKRYILAGGRIPEESDDDDDDNDDDDDHHDGGDQEAPGEPHIAPHALPLLFMRNYIKAYNVKHVIDLSPSPLGLAFEVVKEGGSYVAVCATKIQADYLKDQLQSKLVKGIVDKNYPLLYDARFAPEVAVEGALVS